MMRLSIEMDNHTRDYGKIHYAGCPDLRDPQPLGIADTYQQACRLFERQIGWCEDPYFAVCVELDGMP